MHEFETIEQREIRESVRKLAEKEIPSYLNEKYFGTLPRNLFSSLASLGLAGLAVEEQFGGIHAGALMTAAVMEELAAVNLGPAIFVSVHSMVSGLIQKYGSTEQKKKYLPKMAAGDYLGAFGLTEPTAGSDAGSLRATAKKEKNSYILNGEKCYITSAGFADVYVVFAKTAPEKGKDGISAFIVDKNAKGISIDSPEKKMGCELSPIASIHFHNVELPFDALLGKENEGYAISLSGLAGGRVNIAACANGISRSALQKALAHLKEREQFGSKLIEFQGLQFMLADMKMKLEASRLLTWKAARILEENPSARSNRIDPSIAKCFATDAAMAISTDAVQLLGGAGYIKEYEVERLMRDAKMLQIVEGTNQVQRLVITRELSKD